MIETVKQFKEIPNHSLVDPKTDQSFTTIYNLVENIRFETLVLGPSTKQASLMRNIIVCCFSDGTRFPFDIMIVKSNHLGANDTTSSHTRVFYCALEVRVSARGG